MAELNGKIVKMTPSDQPEPIETPYEYAVMSVTIKNMLEDLGDDLSNPVPVHNCKAKELTKVIEWCKHRHENPEDKDKGIEHIRELDDWEKKFTGDLSQPETFQLILAANYLDIKPLLNLLCKWVALQLAGKTPEQIRAYFGVDREFTPEEVEAVKRERGLIPPDAEKE